MNRKLYLLVATILLTNMAMAQIQVNPQIGLTIQNISKPPAGIDYEGGLGFKVGTDVRIGKRFYFQPGLFYSKSATVIKFTDVDTVQIKDNLIRTSLDAKALVGFRVVNKAGFGLRLMAGPSYDFLLSVDSKENTFDPKKSDFNSGSFNLDAGVGVDIWFLTGELGYRYGLTNAYKDNNNNVGNLDSKYLSFYFSLGILIGKGVL